MIPTGDDDGDQSELRAVRSQLDELRLELVRLRRDLTGEPSREPEPDK